MKDHEPPFDIKAALDESTILITSARADLIKTIDTYDANGPELAKTALERLQLLNPDVSPARADAIAGLNEELPRFSDFWVPLAGNAGILLIALVNNLTSMALQMMSFPFPSGADTESLDATSAALAFLNAPHEAVKRNQIIMSCAVVAETEVANALQEAVGLLIARLNLLAAFIHRTEPAPRDMGITPKWIKFISKFLAALFHRTEPAPTDTGVAPSFIKFVIKTVGNEAVLLAAEEFVKAAIKELPKQVPVVSIAASVITISQEVREKQETLRERRELLEKIAAAYLDPNITDDMSIQLAHLKKDNENIKELLSLIDNLTLQLTLPPAGSGAQPSTPGTQ
jgi:hypothetical protein